MNIFEKEIQDQRDKETAKKNQRLRFNSEVRRLIGFDPPSEYTSLTSIPGYEITSVAWLDNEWHVYKLVRSLSGGRMPLLGDDEDSYAFLGALRRIVGESAQNG